MRVSLPLSIILLCSMAAVGTAKDKPPDLPVISVAQKHACYVTAVACSKDGKLATSSDMKGNVLLWEVGTELKKKGEFRATNGPGVEKWVQSVALSPDGKHLAAGSDDKNSLVVGYRFRQASAANQGAQRKREQRVLPPRWEARGFNRSFRKLPYMGSQMRYRTKESKDRISQGHGTFSRWKISVLLGWKRYGSC